METVIASIKKRISKSEPRDSSNQTSLEMVKPGGRKVPLNECNFYLLRLGVSERPETM